MIPSFCDALRRSINETIEARREDLERGSSHDERARGEIRALRVVLETIADLEDRARRQAAGADDMF